MSVFETLYTFGYKLIFEYSEGAWLANFSEINIPWILDIDLSLDPFKIIVETGTIDLWTFLIILLSGAVIILWVAKFLKSLILP